MRIGKTNQPYYKIIVKETRSKRDGRFTDQIGYYRPLSRDNNVKIDTIKYTSWIKKGAQPTLTVTNLYRRYYGKTT